MTSAKPSSSPYLSLSRAQWARLRADTPLTLTARELGELRGINSSIDLGEVESIYLPLCRLLNLYVTSTQQLAQATQLFLGHKRRRVPYIIGLGGSVAVGKSTSARILRTLLSRWPNSPRVDLITTDGFLLPNAELKRRGLMNRKGFPESYDQQRLLEFVAAIKGGAARVSSPIYSHITYDIVPHSELTVTQPDIVIVEGLNVLQSPPAEHADRVFVSDYFDFSIYIDAALKDLRRWYTQRFITLRDTAFRDPHSYFHRFASMSDDQTVEMAERIWRDINELNLHENILPTKKRADLILTKGSNHVIERIRLRKL